MSTPISPKVAKGALVQLTEALLTPVPNVIVFQYNPEQLSRTLTPYSPPPDQASTAQNAGSADTSQPYDPGETINVVIEFDAIDDLEKPDQHPVAVASGIADRIAAVESLLYPTAEAGLLSNAVASLGGAAASALGGALGISAPAAAPATRPQVPIVLFVWGPGRIVPVRISSFQLEEQMFSTTLYPIRAKLTLGLTLLGPAFFAQRRSVQNNKLSAAESIAEAAYTFTRNQKDLLAKAAITHNVDSMLSMLPF
jgi:hypothetical protein